jgi:hypothetical protein
MDDASVPHHDTSRHDTTGSDLMSTESTTSNRNQKLIGLLWGAFAILAAFALFDDHRAVPIICWSLALVVAIALFSIHRRTSAESSTDRRADPKVHADQV